jgi:hypothetical protein
MVVLPAPEGAVNMMSLGLSMIIKDYTFDSRCKDSNIFGDLARLQYLIEIKEY